LVQWNGLAFSFHAARYFVIAFSSWRTLSKLPRRMAWSVIRANQRSTRFSHDELVGVK
jgi:hypothetical protein